MLDPHKFADIDPVALANLWNQMLDRVSNASAGVVAPLGACGRPLTRGRHVERKLHCSFVGDDLFVRRVLPGCFLM